VTLRLVKSELTRREQQFNLQDGAIMTKMLQTQRPVFARRLVSTGRIGVPTISSRRFRRMHPRIIHASSPGPNRSYGPLPLRLCLFAAAKRHDAREARGLGATVWPMAKGYPGPSAAGPRCHLASHVRRDSTRDPSASASPNATPRPLRDFSNDNILLRNRSASASLLAEEHQGLHYTNLCSKMEDGDGDVTTALLSSKRVRIGAIQLPVPAGTRHMT
jgi:hypothetical protein